MKVIVVGGGGREHSLAWKLAQSPEVEEIVCAPGNAGTAAIGRNEPVGAEDIEGLTALARREGRPGSSSTKTPLSSARRTSRPNAWRSLSRVSISS